MSPFLVLVGALVVVSSVRSAHRRGLCMPDRAPALALDMTSTLTFSQARGPLLLTSLRSPLADEYPRPVPTGGQCQPRLPLMQTQRATSHELEQSNLAGKITECRVVPATTFTTTPPPAGLEASPTFADARPDWGPDRGHHDS